jgi:hypothetical protein
MAAAWPGCTKHRRPYRRALIRTHLRECAGAATEKQISHSKDIAERSTKMELDRALELAVVSSWNELVSTGEPCSVHVEYQNVSSVPLNSVEVWMIKNRGYGTLICRCSVPSSQTADTSGCVFGNAYRSETLGGDLDFILRNQSQFSRAPGGSVHGLVQVGQPNAEDRSDATSWSRSWHADVRGNEAA